MSNKLYEYNQRLYDETVKKYNLQPNKFFMKSEIVDLSVIPHADDGPSSYTSDMIVFMKDGKRSRLDGPAFIWKNSCHEWWINGEKVCDKIHSWAEERQIDLFNLTDDDVTEIKLFFNESA